MGDYYISIKYLPFSNHIKENNEVLLNYFLNKEELQNTYNTTFLRGLCTFTHIQGKIRLLFFYCYLAFNSESTFTLKSSRSFYINYTFESVQLHSSLLLKSDRHKSLDSLSSVATAQQFTPLTTNKHLLKHIR